MHTQTNLDIDIPVYMINVSIPVSDYYILIVQAPLIIFYGPGCGNF